MNAFNSLRAQARTKRDKAIRAARDEYAATLVRIADLEQDLLGREAPNHKSIASCIERVMPTDRTFTTTDIMAALEALDPRRDWRKRSLDSHISRLREKGLVRRVKKASKHEPAIYVVQGVATEPRPFEGKTLAQAVAEMLKLGHKTPTEVTVALRDAGYESAMTPANLRAHIGRLMRDR